MSKFKLKVDGLPEVGFSKVGPLNQSEGVVEFDLGEPHEEKPGTTARCDKCCQVVEWLYDEDEGMWWAPWCWHCRALSDMWVDIHLLGKHYDEDRNLRPSGIDLWVKLVTDDSVLLKTIVVKDFSKNMHYSPFKFPIKSK